MDERPDIPEHVTHRQYFDCLLKDRVNKSTIPKISSLNAIIRFEITDNEKGTWNVIVENGFVKEVTREIGQEATCAFTTDSATFLSIIKRELTPQQAFFKGKVNIKGDMFFALKMNVLVSYM